MMLGAFAFAASRPSVNSARHSRLPITTNTGSLVAPSTSSTRPMPLATSPTSPVTTIASAFSSWKNFAYFLSARMLRPESSFTGPRTPMTRAPSESFSVNVRRAPVCFAVRSPNLSSVTGPGSMGAAHSLSARGSATGVGTATTGLTTSTGLGSTFLSGQPNSPRDSPSTAPAYRRLFMRKFPLASR